MMTRLKKIVSNLILLFSTIVVLCLALEFILRAVYKDEIVLYPRYHTDFVYGDFRLRGVRPNSEFLHTSIDGSWRFITNKQGFRNYKNVDYAKPEGVVRIICLGDSHTQGYEVRQDFTYSSIIKKYLERRGYNAETMNTGVSGFSTAEELIFLENEGIKYSPDFVVLGFYANDFEDNIKAGLFKLEQDGGLVIDKKEYIPGVRIQNIIHELPFVKYLSEHSYLYSMFFNSIWVYFKTRLARESHEKVTEYALPTQTEFSDYETALTSMLIKRMYDFCRTNNVKLIIVDIPQVSKFGGIKSSFASTLLDTAANHSDAYVDSVSLLGDYQGVAEIHLPHGHRHISEFTHAIIGVAVAKKIELEIDDHPTAPAL